MTLNLITFSIFYFLIISSVVGYGYFVVNLTNLNKSNINFGYMGLFGVFILTFLSYLSHFVIPHNFVFNSLILFFGIFLFLFSLFKEKKNILDLLKLYLFFLIIIISFILYKNHDDFSYYHFPYTYYLTQNNLMVGIGNFNHGFRTPSSIFFFFFFVLFSSN